MENPAIARIFSEIADLLEIKGENPFKIRAYRNAADTIDACHRAARLLHRGTTPRDVRHRQRSRVRRFARSPKPASAQYHRDLLEQFPPTILDLLHLQGVGPKTVAQLYTQLGIRTVDELEAACRDGRVRELKGMGSKKEQLILKACAERKQHSGRHLLPDAAEAARLLLDYLRAECPTVTFVVGWQHTPWRRDLRRYRHPRDRNRPAGDADLHDVQARRSGPGAGRHEIQRAALGRHSGGSPPRACRKPGRRDAVFYGLEIPQHRASRSRHRARLQTERIRLVPRSRMDASSPDAPKRRSTTRSASRRFHRSCAKDAERSRQPNDALFPCSSTLADIRGDIHSHTTETDGREGIETMAIAAREAGLTLPGDHRPQQSTGDGQRS